MISCMLNWMLHITLSLCAAGDESLTDISFSGMESGLKE